MCGVHSSGRRRGGGSASAGASGSDRGGSISSSRRRNSRSSGQQEVQGDGGCFLAPDLLLAGSLHAQLIQLCTGCRLAWMVALLSSASGCQCRGWRFPLRMLDSMGNRQPTGVQTAC